MGLRRTSQICMVNQFTSFKTNSKRSVLNILKWARRTTSIFRYSNMDVVLWMLYYWPPAYESICYVYSFYITWCSKRIVFLWNKESQLVLIRVFPKTPPTHFYAFEKARFFSMVGRGTVGGGGGGWVGGGYIILPHISE